MTCESPVNANVVAADPVYMKGYVAQANAPLVQGMTPREFAACAVVWERNNALPTDFAVTQALQYGTRLMTASVEERMLTVNTNALLIPNATVFQPPVVNVNYVQNANHHIVPVGSHVPQRLVIPSASILGASVDLNVNQLVLQNDLDFLDLSLAAKKSARRRAIKPPS